MSIQSDLIEDYSRNSRLLNQHMEGLSHADTLVRPGGTGNCIHWIFGHLLLCRVEMLDLLGGQASVTEEDLQRYGNGVEPVGPESGDIVPLEQLKNWWQTVDGEFMQAIQAASDETMLGIINTGRREMPLHRRLHFYFFHEAFHLGQFETLRHVAGKTESLI